MPYTLSQVTELARKIQNETDGFDTRYAISRKEAVYLAISACRHSDADRLTHYCESARFALTYDDVAKRPDFYRASLSRV